MEKMADSPSFPHHWPEASRQLGIPDSPVVHLAIRTIAQRLLDAYGSQCQDWDAAQITALRCASRAALESESFELATLRFHLYADMHVDAALEARAREAVRTNWLGQATQQILAEGDDPGPDAKRLATSYGWTSIDR